MPALDCGVVLLLPREEVVGQGGGDPSRSTEGRTCSCFVCGDGDGAAEEQEAAPSPVIMRDETG